MRITLTLRQITQLQPYIDRVRAAAAAGDPGMLVAQINWSDKDGSYWLTPAFLDHELAKVITERGRAEIPGPLRLEKRRSESTLDKASEGRS